MNRFGTVTDKLYTVDFIWCDMLFLKIKQKKGGKAGGGRWEAVADSILGIVFK